MIDNNLSKIFSTVKLYDESNNPIHEKIASISRISRNLCNNIIITTLNDIVSIYKKVY